MNWHKKVRFFKNTNLLGSLFKNLRILLVVLLIVASILPVEAKKITPKPNVKPTANTARNKPKATKKNKPAAKKKLKGKPNPKIKKNNVKNNPIPIPIFGVVNSENNQEQWEGITKRLQKLNINYCVVPLSKVQNSGDWGRQKVLFLPNVQVLSSEQAIALENWVNQGGYLIASGPVGNGSVPGVKQLLTQILGGYWAFSLNSPQELQPSADAMKNWEQKKELLGTVKGGVLIRDNSNSQTTFVWKSPDRPLAILTTSKSTFLGWQWGIDTVASPSLDIAWLKEILNNTTTIPPHAKNQKLTNKTTIKPARNCTDNQVFIPENKLEIQAKKSNQTSINNTVNPSVIPNLIDPINQLEQKFKLDVIPTSQKPIDQKEAIALRQELENLIGRVESANLTASIYNNNNQTSNIKQETEKTVTELQQTLTKARIAINTISTLIADKKYSQARQLWLRIKTELWQQFPISQKIAQPEIRAVWLDRGTIVKAGNEAGLKEIFDRLAKAGINTVFLETVNASYTIYPSKIAPQQNPLTQNWDPLASAVKLAHQRGIELHAWVWVFAAGNLRHNEIIGVNANYLGPVLSTNPDWANYDNKGNIIPIGQNKPFLDPANPQVREYLLKLYEEIVTKYEVDGLHLDYIRYPFQDPLLGRTYGYGKAAREKFQQQTGIDPVNISPKQREIWQKWTAFRTAQIDSFVSEVSQMLRTKNRYLLLSAAVFPLPEYERIEKLQQHWEVWARTGDIDLIMPMTYAKDTPRFQKLAQPWIESTKLGSTLLVPGIRLLSLPTMGAFDQLQLIRDLPTSGYALFAVDNFNSELEEIFNNTQGKSNNSTRKNEPIPQRHPFRTAAVRYTALQKEWQIMKINTNSQLNQYDQQLENALSQLAILPSASNFIKTKKAFNLLELEFLKTINSDNTINSYQVKVWKNRLLMIERLLNYGERRINLRR